MNTCRARVLVRAERALVPELDVGELRGVRGELRGGGCLGGHRDEPELLDDDPDAERARATDAVEAERLVDAEHLRVQPLARPRVQVQVRVLEKDLDLVAQADALLLLVRRCGCGWVVRRGSGEKLYD